MRRRARNRLGDASGNYGTKAYATGNSRWTLLAFYYRWSKWVTEAFKAFGRHCARNQVSENRLVLRRFPLIWSFPSADPSPFDRQLCHDHSILSCTRPAHPAYIDTQREFASTACCRDENDGSAIAALYAASGQLLPISGACHSSAKYNTFLAHR